MFFGSKKQDAAKAAAQQAAAPQSQPAAPTPAAAAKAPAPQPSTPPVAAAPAYQSAPQMSAASSGNGVTPPPSAAPMAAAPGAPADAPALSQDELKKRAAASKLVSASFGEIVSVLMRSEHYKSYTLQDLEWLVVPAVLSNQFLLAEARAKGNGFTAPVGVVLWANVSPEVDQRLTANVAQPIRLNPQDWRSGNIPWLVDAVGPPKLIGGMLQQLHGKVFKGQPVKVRTQGPDGKPVVRIMEMKAQAAN